MTSKMRKTGVDSSSSRSVKGTVSKSSASRTSSDKLNDKASLKSKAKNAKNMSQSSRGSSVKNQQSSSLQRSDVSRGNVSARGRMPERGQVPERGQMYVERGEYRNEFGRGYDRDRPQDSFGHEQDPQGSWHYASTSDRQLDREISRDADRLLHEDALRRDARDDARFGHDMRDERARFEQESRPRSTYADNYRADDPYRNEGYGRSEGYSRTRFDEPHPRDAYGSDARFSERGYEPRRSRDIDAYGAAYGRGFDERSMPGGTPRSPREDAQFDDRYAAPRGYARGESALGDWQDTDDRGRHDYSGYGPSYGARDWNRNDEPFVSSGNSIRKDRSREHMSMPHDDVPRDAAGYGRVRSDWSDDRHRGLPERFESRSGPSRNEMMDDDDLPPSSRRGGYRGRR